VLDDIQQKCLMNLASEEDKAVYNRVRGRLKYLLPGDKGQAYKTLLKLAEDVSYPELVMALGELAVVDGRISFGASLIGFLDGMNKSQPTQYPGQQSPGHQ